MPCGKAIIDPLYEHGLAVQLLVDYMFFMDPHSDDAKTLLDLEEKHTTFINFTTFPPMRKYPVMLRIKSKDLYDEDFISPELHLAA
ncbi:hypothetical protein NW768_002358 [Fusarium equiseti]|uniref:Uncharacterized protein n=1 Tax=Fusarium equiseti TaxID=61235 RepID=A0ABQ8RNA3_FUSEQ|nr:hypothetical protein NW768_002358 [Fusarium equiseti]